MIPATFQDEEYVRLLAAAEAQKKEAEKEGNLSCGSNMQLEYMTIFQSGDASDVVGPDAPPRKNNMLMIIRSSVFRLKHLGFCYCSSTLM